MLSYFYYLLNQFTCLLVYTIQSAYLTENSHQLFFALTMINYQYFNPDFQLQTICYWMINCEIKQKQQMPQTTSTLITQIEPKHDSHSYEQIDQLASLKNDILHKMQLIDSLNATYKEKNQISFLKTFRKIMNDLSEQLKNAVQAYQNIDQQIQTDPKCILLSTQAQFYRNQRQVLDSQYHQELSRLNEVKMKNQQLKVKRDKLRAKSVHSQQKILKYSDKNNTLSLRFGHMLDDSQDNHQTNNKKITESTKYNTSADKTRIPSLNSVNRKTFFDNMEIQENKSSKRGNSLSRKRFTKVVTSQNATAFRLNNFF